MDLFRTSLLVVLSCAVMSVQAANWNKSKAKPIVSSINPVEIIDVASAPNTLCRPDGTKTKPYANYKYPQFNYEEFTTSREATTNKLAHSMHAVTVTLLIRIPETLMDSNGGSRNSSQQSMTGTTRK